MRYALTLAERGRGWVEPNPLVGALVVRQGEVISDGFHAKYGEAHAEVVALQRIGELARGATLYVTLEPCCHVGKTPPCVEAVLAAGIRRVVVAMTDPFPQVAGQGIARLSNAGVEVTVGVCEAEARRLNRPYLTLIEKARSYVHLKWAMTLDGKLATRTGDSQWISNEASRKIVHELRGRMDAIIVGAGTVRQDDPLLTARPPGPRSPTRIVLTTKPELPTTSQLLHTATESPVILATAHGAAPLTPSPPGVTGAAPLTPSPPGFAGGEGRGEGGKTPAPMEILPLESANGRPSVAALLAELGRRRMTNVLVEGGAEVFGSFLDAGVVDEVHVFIAPIVVGGTDAKSPIAGIGAERIASALRLADCNVQTIEGDVYIHGTC
jgi:diaminohydroxyphosphoribosylaminopyrimidine deaminase/5-amino-6-(5-phosphoribosylamino)uracil reductase